jgi:hypothetical protein
MPVLVCEPCNYEISCNERDPPIEGYAPVVIAMVLTSIMKNWNNFFAEIERVYEQAKDAVEKLKTVNALMTKTIENSPKNLETRLANLENIYVKVSGNQGSSHECLKHVINELYLNHNVIELRDSLVELKKLKEDLERF